jgi:mono/diheme cytochrome c family protein
MTRVWMNEGCGCTRPAGTSLVGKIAAVALGALLSACVWSTSSRVLAEVSPHQSALSPSIANGRSIFQTGRDSNGTRIAASPPALYPKCASCHRSNGAGGRKFPDGAVSADLRHSALVTHQQHPYTLALLERAISSGVDNDRHRLDPVMPRWKLSQRDLHDVAEYVLTQLK